MSRRTVGARMQTWLPAIQALLTAGLNAIRAGRPFDVVLLDEHARVPRAKMEALRRSLPGARYIVACRDPAQFDALCGPGGADVIRLE